MTTMAVVDETLARFGRKSPRDSYKQVCEEMGIHMQRGVYASLSEKPSSWHYVHTLDLEKTLLGTRGCLALLPLITVSTSLRKLHLRSCGLSDEFVVKLCFILQGHPSLRSVDISDNELVSVNSATHIISVMRNNANMVLFDVSNTHVGANVANIIASLGERNLENVVHYFADRYFLMKNLFNYMDADGTGWVPLKSLVLNCPFPILQEQFIERIALKRPRKRSDNSISINTFLQLVYMNYKTESEIGRMAEKPVDEPYVCIILNWKQVLRATARYNARAKAAGTKRAVELPADLHRWRLRDFVLLNDDADALIETAVQLMEHAPLPTAEDVARADEVELSAAATAADADVNNEGTAMTTRAPLRIPITVFLQAARSALVTPPSAVRPTYQFYKEHDVTYVPAILRNGSRTMSIGGLSAFLADAAAPPSVDGASTAMTGDVAQDPADPLRTFSLPASVVRMIVALFNAEAAKLPKKKNANLPESPKKRRDRAMEKTAIPVPAFLSAELVTPLERVCPRLLGDYYARHALLIDEGTITLQEMVNVLDEMYVQCRIETAVPLAEMARLPDPLLDKAAVAFLTSHLEAREEELSAIEPHGEDGEL